MKYHLSPRWLIVIAATAALTASNMSQARPAPGPDTSDSRSALADLLAAAQVRLDATAAKQVGVEDAIDKARDDVDRIAIELAKGRDPKSVIQELLQVRTRVDDAADALAEVIAELDTLQDVFMKIRIAASTLNTPAISHGASIGLSRVRTLQSRTKTDRAKIGKLNQDIQTLLTKAQG